MPPCGFHRLLLLWPPYRTRWLLEQLLQQNKYLWQVKERLEKELEERGDVHHPAP